MTAPRIHAVIAAGLADPALLQRWREAPALLGAYGVEPGAFDLDGLWKAAGLAAKVRHNGLRGDFPLSFRLMSVAGMEIELFGAYAAARRGHFAPSAAARAQDLLDFLERWLDPGNRAHALLLDLLRHELALATLARAAPVEPPARRRPGTASVPLRSGATVLHRLGADPRRAAAELHRRAPRLGRIERTSFPVCYWRPPGAEEVRLVELDELGFYLLCEADGSRSIARMSRGLGGRAAERALLGAAVEFARLGLLAFAADPEKRRAPAARR